MNSAPAQHSGSASGINNAVSRVAGLLAIAVLGIVVVSATHRALPQNDAALSAPVRSVVASDALLSGRAPDRGIPARIRGEVQHVVAKSYVSGFRDAMLICAALALLSSAIAFTMLRTVPAGKAAEPPSAYLYGKGATPKKGAAPLR
jgi:hypothetical protein